MIARFWGLLILYFTPMFAANIMTDLKNIDEHFVQNVWNDQRFFNFDLQTTNGRPISVLKSGVSKSEEGPDWSRRDYN